jgi:hypothetical protein
VNDSLVPILIALLGAGGGASLLNAWLGRKKLGADTAGATVTAAGHVVALLEARLETMVDERRELVDRVGLLEHDLAQVKADLRHRLAILETWEIGATRLVAQIESLGHAPVWRPERTEGDIR